MKKYVRRILFGFSLSLVCMSALADDGVIKIGVIGPVTGESSEDMGQSIIGGARVFASDINQMGGILGRRVEIVERDDKAKPDIGVQVSKELIEKEKVVAAVGFANTGVALPAAKVFQNAKIPLIVSAATGAAVARQFMPPAVPVSFIFRTSASDALQPIVILNDVLDRRKIDKIALLHDDTPYGLFGKQSVLEEMERRKLKPVDIESFKIGDRDMTPQLLRAKAAGAHAIIVYSLAAEAAMVAKSAAKLKLNIPIDGPWTLSQKSFADMAGPNAEGARTAVTYIENGLSTASAQFALAYRKTNKITHIPSAVAAAQTYDALRLLTLAIYQANSTDGDKIREALENLRLATTSTVVSRYYKPFSPKDHEAITVNMIVMGEIRNGQVRYAYKEDENRGLIARRKQVQ